MTFLFVDALTQTAIDKPIVGVKRITEGEPFLIENAAGERVFMPALVGEAIGQLGAWAVMASTDFCKRPVAGVVANVAMLADVYPGQVLQLETHIDGVDNEAVEYHGRAMVEGQTIFTVDGAIGPMLRMTTFIDKVEVMTQYQALINGSRPLSRCPSDMGAYTNLVPSFDKLLSFQKDLVVAELLVDEHAPYLNDHFPNKPVLPLTLLLNAKLDLAMNYLNEFVAHNVFKPAMLRKIKMSQFVVPNDCLTTTLKVKSQTADEIVFVFKSEVESKRVCVCEMVFRR